MPKIVRGIAVQYQQSNNVDVRHYTLSGAISKGKTDKIRQDSYDGVQTTRAANAKRFTTQQHVDPQNAAKVSVTVNPETLVELEKKLRDPTQTKFKEAMKKYTSAEDGIEDGDLAAAIVRQYQKDKGTPRKSRNPDTNRGFTGKNHKDPIN